MIQECDSLPVLVFPAHRSQLSEPQRHRRAAGEQRKRRLDLLTPRQESPRMTATIDAHTTEGRLVISFPEEALPAGSLASLPGCG